MTLILTTCRLDLKCSVLPAPAFLISHLLYVGSLNLSFSFLSFQTVACLGAARLFPASLFRVSDATSVALSLSCGGSTPA